MGRRSQNLGTLRRSICGRIFLDAFLFFYKWVELTGTGLILLLISWIYNDYIEPSVQCSSGQLGKCAKAGHAGSNDKIKEAQGLHAVLVLLRRYWGSVIFVLVRGLRKKGFEVSSRTGRNVNGHSVIPGR